MICQQNLEVFCQVRDGNHYVWICTVSNRLVGWGIGIGEFGIGVTWYGASEKVYLTLNTQQV